MVKYIAYYCIIFNIILNSCSYKDASVQDKSEQEASRSIVYFKELKSHLSFPIDSINTYPIKKTRDFIFSPLNQKNKLWIDGYELDLKSGDLKSFEEWFGKAGKTLKIHERLFWRDEYSGTLYINLNHHLLTYATKRDTFFISELTNVTVMYFEKEVFYFTNRDALYRYDRSTQDIECLKNFNDLYVFSIAGAENGLTLSSKNGVFAYSFANCTLQVSAGNKHKSGNSTFRRYLPSTQYGNYVKRKEENYSWYYNRGDIYLSASDTIFQYEGDLFGNSLNELKTDSLYVYLLFSDTLQVINKGYFKNRCKLFDYQKHKSEYLTVSDFHPAYDLGLYSVINEVDSFQNVYIDSEFPDIVHTIKSLPYQVIGSSYITIEELAEAIEYNRLDRKYLKPALSRLYGSSVWKFDLMKAIYYGKQYHNIWPEDSSFFKELESIQLDQKAFESINSSNMLVDEKLYNRGKLKMTVMSHSRIFGEYKNDSLPFDDFNIIMKKYPQSEFADDAAYHTILHRYFWDPGAI
ncbi:hypothetical protein LVD15_19070 [Fulvivirga maritima]|uniref:hypothetical protein n=1 Tax=Fulvivirga maritima TaxID=2904247 RepID=UPI001F259A2C|nr:hypothetical protein [Fulvivirga maritima]UII25388.1 hypothetical protein LVD15_19070 [Fulvivirga maritima]